MKKVIKNGGCMEFKKKEKNFLIDMIKETYDECVDIVRHKNSDYATDEDPFKNFRLVQNIGLASVEVGILVRISDKIARIVNLLKHEPNCQEESIEDTLKDTINYLAILRCFIKKEKMKK